MTLPPLPYGPEPAEPATKRGFGSGAGRAKGQKDKITIALKEAILLAAEEAGDVLSNAAAEKGTTIPGGLAGYLTMVATTDVRSFCGLLGKVLPMQVTGAGDGPVIVEIVRMASANA